jgi:hypothetical protein
MKAGVESSSRAECIATTNELQVHTPSLPLKAPIDLLWRSAGERKQMRRRPAITR